MHKIRNESELVAAEFKKIMEATLPYPFIDFNIKESEKKISDSPFKISFDSRNYSATIFLLNKTFLEKSGDSSEEVENFLIKEIASMHLWPFLNLLGDPKRSIDQIKFLENDLANVFAIYISKLVKLSKEKMKNDVLDQNLKKWIEQTLKKILSVTFLPPLSFSISFDSRGDVDNSEAKIQYLSKKRIAKLTILPPFIKYWEKGEKSLLEEVLIHEVAHIHTAELLEIALNAHIDSKVVEEINERAVGTLSKYIKTILKDKKGISRVEFYDINFE